MPKFATGTRPRQNRKTHSPAHADRGLLHGWLCDAYPIALEALLLLGFGVLGVSTGAAPQVLPLALPLLCFLMGLQNATITKLSGARIRTTHLTGMVTDIGIEIGKLVYLHRDSGRSAHLRVVADRQKLALLAVLVTTFLAGGAIGAVGFSIYGYVFCVPLAALLFLLAVPQLLPARRLQNGKEP